jgi:effector-binding domain-containing protein
MRYEVSTLDLPEQPIVSIRQHLPTVDMPGFFGQSYQELYMLLGELGVQGTGAPFVIYHAFGPGDVDAEVAVPVGFLVTFPAAQADRMISRVLPAGTVARTLHQGPYDQLGTAYTELTEWVGDHGFEAVGPARERYLNEPGPDLSPADYLTEIDIPVTTAKVPAAV